MNTDIHIRTLADMRTERESHEMHGERFFVKLTDESIQQQEAIINRLEELVNSEGNMSKPIFRDQLRVLIIELKGR